MNNLTTRKIVLGLLMTCVLAFGVQGVAEAIGDPDIATATLNPNAIQNVAGPVDISITLDPDSSTRRESVSISKSSGIDFTGTNFFGLSSISLREVDDDLTDGNDGTNFTYRTSRGVDREIGTGSVTIPIRFNNKGKQTVRISSTDYDGPDAGSWSYTYTYYVRGLGTKTTTVSLVRSREGIVAGDDHQVEIHNGDSGHYQVTYTTVPTGGTFQIEQPGGSLTTLTAANSSSAFDVLLAMSRSYQVNAQVMGSDITTTETYIIGSPTLAVGSPGDDDRDGVVEVTTAVGNKEMGGRINQVLPKAFSAFVTDGAGNNVPGVVVTFRVRGSGDAGGYLVFDSVTTTGGRAPNVGTLVTSNNREMFDTNGNPVTIATEKVLYIRTEGNGLADVDFQLGTDRKQDVTVSAVRQTKIVSAYAGESVSGNQLVEPSRVVSRALGRAGEYELRVKAEDDDGDALPNAYVEFRTSDGELEDPGTAESSTLGRLGVQTDTRGKAFIFFDPKDDSGSLRVTAHLLDLGDDNEVGGTGDAADTVIDDVVFDIGGTVTRQPTPSPAQQVARLAITIAGEGATRGVIVNALNSAGQTLPISIPVTLSGTALTTSRSTTTGAAVAITLPTAADTYTLIATDPGGNYVQARTTITVGTPTADGTLSIEAIGTPAANRQQIVEVTARNTAGTGVEGVVVRLSGPFFATRTVTTLDDGSVRGLVTIPSATGEHTLTATASGYKDDEITLSAAGVVTPPVTPPPATPPPPAVAAVPSSIQISGPAARSGTVNTQLDSPLLVRVLDDVGTGVADARVIFRVITGRGKLSERGNGRAVGVQTDSSGYARANFTPTDDGPITVRASTTDISATVEFTITTGSAPTTRDAGTGVTPGASTTPGTISPVVHVAAASRQPMLWVDGGAIYALVGASPERFAPSVDNALNLTVGGGKVYWTEKTGESGGTINSANVDGSGVTELASIFATPMGIAVDVTNSKLYWTNSAGRIQSANLDGSRITNVIPGGLEGAMDIALAGGNAYWTQGGNVRFVNLRGTKQIRNVSTGTDAAGSLVIGGGKVYWTEKTGESGGTVNSANLNGTGEMELASILAAPSGIAVDGSRSKLYWTNARGRVQSANLDGSKITNVVSGLGSPGDMVLSNSITAPAGAGSSAGSGTTASDSKYDVNGDGSVNNADSDAITVAIAAGATDAKYDVNGDGAVNVFDLVEIIANRDPGAAGAPTLFGMKMSAVQIDHLQEQIDLLIATNDRSPAAMRTLVYLQQLLVTARPEKTQLLANYPNPFNPETWIPYELATDTNVRLTIYNTQGVVIRTLQFGHQSAGYYTGRDRAAYWDGRNALGEQVASGLYFYQLETDEMSLMRKMVILKYSNQLSVGEVGKPRQRK